MLAYDELVGGDETPLDAAGRAFAELRIQHERPGRYAKLRAAPARVWRFLNRTHLLASNLLLENTRANRRVARPAARYHGQFFTCKLPWPSPPPHSTLGRSSRLATLVLVQLLCYYYYYYCLILRPQGPPCLHCRFQAARVGLACHVSPNPSPSPNPYP